MRNASATSVSFVVAKRALRDELNDIIIIKMKVSSHLSEFVVPWWASSGNFLVQVAAICSTMALTLISKMFFNWSDTIHTCGHLAKAALECLFF